MKPMAYYVKPPVTKQEFQDLEVYYFRLIMYTESDEFWSELTDHDRVKIRHEIGYIYMSLDILGKHFADRGKNEKPVMAIKRDIEGDYAILYRFSSAKVASLALGCNAGHITGVCKGKRIHTGGYVFQYEEDQHKEHLNFNGNRTKFEFR